MLSSESFRILESSRATFDGGEATEELLSGSWTMGILNDGPVVLVGILGDGGKQIKSVVWSWRPGPFQRRGESCGGCAARLDSYAVI